MNQYTDTVNTPVFFDRSWIFDVNQILSKAMSGNLLICNIKRYIAWCTTVYMYILRSNLQIERFIAIVIAKLQGREPASKYVESVASPMALATYDKKCVRGAEYASGDRNIVLSKHFCGFNGTQYRDVGVLQSGY